MTRSIAWIKAAQKEFRLFPLDVQDQIMTALRIAARGSKSDIAKPMKGLGSGVFEIALAYRRDAYRTVYAVQLGEDLWVIHAFKKKSSKGMTTSKKVIDLIEDRIKKLKEELR